MIIARAPFRITLGGGGTDLPSFYRRHGGFVFAMGIDKYVNVLLNPTVVDRRIRLQYMQSEVVDHVSLLRHPLAREALRLHGIESSIEITSVADLPARAGVGSSGSYLVAMLTALRSYRNRPCSLGELAEEACHIEIDVLREPVGKQDQYMAVFGGMRAIEIGRDGAVRVESVDLPLASIYELVARMHMYYTGVERSASQVLRAQDDAAQGAGHPEHQAVVDNLLEIKDIGYRSLEAVRRENFDDYGRLMDEHWQRKKMLSARVSLSRVDDLYQYARREFGVLGGKIIGAGGGGFLLLYCPRDHRRLSDYMATQGMQRLHYAPEFQGAKVVADLRSSQSYGVAHGAVAERVTGATG